MKTRITPKQAVDFYVTLQMAQHKGHTEIDGGHKIVDILEELKPIIMKVSAGLITAKKLLKDKDHIYDIETKIQ